MASPRRIASDRRNMLLTLLALLVAVEIGAVVRFFLLSQGDFPLNDGGLFYVMAQDIARSGYVLPAFSSYNGIHMPFVYPPLGFYAGAFLANLFHWPLIDIVRFFPAIINLITILTFFLLADTVLKSRWQAIIAAFAFAVLPRSFKFMIMGGGLTRSPRFLFAILLMQQAYLLYTTHERRYVISSIILGALTVLAHPEMTLYAAWSSFLFMLFFARNRTGLLHSVVVSAGVIVLTAPWWLSVLSQHGLGPFTAAFLTGEQSVALIIALLFTGFGFIEQTLLGVIALLGGVKRIAEGKYLLPVWLISLFIVDLRSAQTFAVIVVALLVAVALDEVLLPMLRRTILRATETTSVALPRRSSRLARGIFGVMLLTYSVFTAMGVPIPVLAKEERDGLGEPAHSTGADFRCDQWVHVVRRCGFGVVSHRGRSLQPGDSSRLRMVSTSGVSEAAGTAQGTTGMR